MTDDMQTIAGRAAESARDPRAHRVPVIAAVISAVGALALGAIFLITRADLRTDVEALARQSASNAAVAEDNAQAADALADQVRSLGQTPVVEPDRLPEPDQVRRAPGPTQAQIAAAVAAYCAEGRCAAPGPTPEQVAAAVEAYCAGNRCRGEQGDEGQDAEGPTAADIANAVATYCADRDQCSGDDGTDGADGAPGRPPAGWSYTDGDGRSYECSPDTPPDPGTAPRYTCRPPAEQPPPDEPPPGDDGPIPGG